MSWTACYDDGCFVHISEKQGQWFPKGPKKHTTKRNLPYAKQPSPPPPPPLQNRKPKQGNSREVHAQKVSWDKCNRKGCKAHKEEKGGTEPLGHGWEERGIKKSRNGAVGKKPKWKTKEPSSGPTCFNNDTSCGRQYDCKMRRLRSNKK